MRTPEAWRELALRFGLELGFDLVGIAGVVPSARLAMFPQWIEAGCAGEMAYLARRSDDGAFLRERITSVWPWARSVLCAAVVYNTAQPPSTAFAASRDRGWISRYAWGEDYHRSLRDQLEQWQRRLAAAAADADEAGEFHATVDTAPIVEREVAWRAGLGWQAKNTCLIHPQKGSYLFLGTIVTSIAMPPDPAPLPDRCGSCTRCLVACPTQALTPYHMDASRCLAYLNIELRGAIPEPMRQPMGNNLLGCDICQDVCPWNRRAPASSEPAFQPRPGLVAPRLAELAAMSEEDYRSLFRHSAVKRAKYTGLQRNIAIAMGNSGNPDFLPQLQTWAAGADPVLAAHATWAMAHIKRSIEAQTES
ncbi:MAG: tRNA epoxyqueuosine(34) reductase QueG [Terriglobales bacterium]